MPVRNALFVIAAASIAACAVAYAPSDPESLPAPCEGGACAADASTGSETSVAASVECLAQPDAAADLETCKCGAEGITEACSFGIVGGTSACQAGSQRCTLADGALRWSACTGATRPAAKETCDDAIDDDCDGKLNNGCVCVDIPLCKDPAGNELPGDTLVLGKTTAKSGEKISVYLLSKSALGVTWITITSGAETLCGGGGGVVPCASSGCAGWNVERRELDTTLSPAAGLFRAGPGTYTIKMRRDVTDSAGNCTSGPNTVSADLTITN